ncbi:hypothetical protein NPIL_402802 [Nephila pilipes]|uniref:Uncharacterized protein n=1 Tax=Nephila pilipes TaxID=299642 RepID=A0A8X6Q4R1_NEPPI|nr:hypothetical protein NPIL_402802 [Nephila pilipes]
MNTDLRRVKDAVDALHRRSPYLNLWFQKWPRYPNEVTTVEKKTLVGTQHSTSTPTTTSTTTTSTPTTSNVWRFDTLGLNGIKTRTQYWTENTSAVS